MVQISRWLLCLTVGWVPWTLGCDPSLSDPPEVEDDADDDAVGDDDVGDDDVGEDDDAGDDDAGDDEAGADPFADEVVEFLPGEGAGHGEPGLPDVVLGPPHGFGEAAGSLDVLSLGLEGEIVLQFTDLQIVDGPGVDLIVFENPWYGWIETGFVAVSTDGVTWHEFPCEPHDAAGGFPGCSGTHPVYSHPDNGLDPTDPEEAGGDGYDLAEVGLDSARYVRVRDSGANLQYGAPTGGYDLDAVSVVHGELIR
jgi:hypothetical protein